MKFVKPETVRIDLEDGEWIEIKKQLSHGELAHLAGSGLTHLTGSAEFVYDMERFEVTKIESWLVDWSARDESGKYVKPTRAAISALEPDDAQRIKQAIDDHVTKLQEEKKLKTGKPEPGATLPS